MCFHTDKVDVSADASPKKGAIDAGLLVRRMARMESEIFSQIIRQAEDVLATRTRSESTTVNDVRLPNPHRLSGEASVPNEQSEFLYNASQASRLVSALSIGLALSGFEADVDFYDIRSLTWAALFGDFTTLAKQFTAWPLSAMQFANLDGSIEVPKAVPGWNYEYLFGSKVRRFIRGRLLNPSSQHSRQALLFGETFLRLKRSAHEVSEVFIFKALKDHGQDIGTPDPTIDHLSHSLSLPVEKIQKEMDRIRSWLKVVVNEILPKDCEKLFLPPSLPSGSAAYQSSRLKGGAATSALRDPYDIDPESDTGCRRRDSGLFGCRVLDRMWHDVKTGRLHEVYVPDFHLEPSSFFGVRGTMEWDLFMDDFLERDDPAIMAEVVAILEPLKVRTITKGEALPYLESRRLQEFLTKRMKTGRLSRFFPALHGFVNAEILNNRLNLAQFGGSFQILSGDYKGATDTLRGDISLFTIQHILSRLPQYRDPKTRAVVEACLTDHQLEYKFKGKRSWSESEPVEEQWQVRQRRGQLMGSFLSFPILNMVNLAVHLAFYEMAGLDALFKVDKLPLIVNGDDVLAVGPPGFFQESHGGFTWEQYVGLVGFKKSLGKNYISDRFCTVNSTLFEVIDRSHLELVACPRIERFYNEQWKSEECDVKPRGSHDPVFMTKFKSGPQMVGGLVKELLLTTDQSRHELAIRLFVALNQEALREVRLPWFLPEDLGGLGIPCLDTMREFWESDAKLAAYLIRRETTGRRVTLPDPTTVDTMKRGCDLERSKLDMEYLKGSGWKDRLFIGPGSDDLRRHESRPKCPVDPSDLMSFGVLPEKRQIYGDPYLKLKQELATLSYRAAHSDVLPMELDRKIIRRLWVPPCKRGEPIGCLNDCGHFDCECTFEDDYESVDRLVSSDDDEVVEEESREASDMDESDLAVVTQINISPAQVHEIPSSWMPSPVLKPAPWRWSLFQREPCYTGAVPVDGQEGEEEQCIYCGSRLDPSEGHHYCDYRK
jgi:hypothetical protein